MTPQVVFNGFGLPARLPFRVTPTMRHLIELEFIDENDDPVDQDDTAWTATMHDSETGVIVFTYSETIEEHEITFTATDIQTAMLDPSYAYEIRIVRDNPGPDMIFAGPVTFTLDTVPVAA
jgi:hypothetical protein